MAGIGQQSKAIRQKPAGELQDHDCRSNNKRDRKSPFVAFASGVMMMMP
jgi:hypothetical protein